MLDRRTKLGVAGLRVEAWDRDPVVDDLLGSAATDAGGGFEIRFEEGYFRELFLDRSPDLFFRVLHGDELIESTRESALWNAADPDRAVVVEVDAPAALLPPATQVGTDAPPPGPATLGKRYVRPLEIPQVVPRTHLHQAPEPLSEVRVERYGMVPTRVVVPTREAGPELLRRLEAELQELPRLATDGGRGAVDVRLEDPEGGHVKAGSVVLEGRAGTVAVPIDPMTRRFRADGLEPGEYRVRGASARAGQGELGIRVREGDVTRAALRLDGTELRGSTSVRLALRGTRAERVQVLGTDRVSGKVVFEGVVPVEQRVVVLERVPFGGIHWEVVADDARSCYDQEVDPITVVLVPPLVELDPFDEFDPDPPPDWGFLGLPDDFRGVAEVLPGLGIHTLEELAAVEPEDLMHRSLAAAHKGHTQVHSRALGEAVDAARSALGVRSVAGAQQSRFRLAEGAEFSRLLAPRAPGEAAVEVELGAGEEAELRIEGPGGAVETHRIVGRGRVGFQVSARDVAAKEPYRMVLSSAAAGRLAGEVRTTFPVEHGVSPVWRIPTTTENIEAVYEALAAVNPGLGTTQPPAVMAPENIQMWIDRARTHMAKAGVCSMNDLGRFRLKPMPVLTTGVYVAPAAPPATVAQVGALHHYIFDRFLSDRVLYYRPNDVLHDAAVVLAGEWDIRGQTVVLGREVRELVVVARSIRHDAASRITWETPPLHGPLAYWPSPAPNGANGGDWGAHGQPGGDGDPNPHPSKNGGANAVTPAPIVTLWVLDTTLGLPPLDLRGQNAGPGGRGQDGGRGGNGHEGLRADGTFFGGCCRGVGFGGNGGQGGDGGRGGQGGIGGRGGLVTLLTSPASIAVLAAAPPTIDVNPGSGGLGGPPGSAGPGGSGGPAGTADCETWCDEHPERRGGDGGSGGAGAEGAVGESGPAIPPDAVQILPITEAQWLAEFNRPHLLDINPDEAEPGETITLLGQNFDPSQDRVYFDGVNVGPVATATTATFTVPLTAEGGTHPVVIRPPGVTDRRSNRVMLRVVPRLDDIAVGTRWVEGQTVNLTGLAFSPGLQLLAEDRSASPVASFMLPTISVTRTAIFFQVPPAPLGSLRGVRRIVARNPDGGTSRGERVARIGDTIVVRCAAFRVVGTTPGVGTTRSAADITALFTEGAPPSIAAPWAQARITFRLVQPVADVARPDNLANLWPAQDNTQDTGIFGAVGVPGALNFFFVRDVEIATAYAYFGGGPLFIGDEGSPLGPVDFQQVVAHEVGHALCLRHVCDAGEGPGTFFNRACDDDEDSAFLMFPFWNTSDGMAIHAGQVDPARLSATHFEHGKTAALPAASLFQGNNTGPQCGAADTQN